MLRSSTIKPISGGIMRFVTFASVLAFAASGVHAEPQQIRRGPLPSWATVSQTLPVPDKASGPVFVQRQDIEVHLSGKVQAQYIGYRLKILQPAALQLGNISIVWNPIAGAPIVHDIKVIRGDQTIDVLKTAKFEILRREDQLEAARLDGNLTAVLRIPDLRVDDALEVNMTQFDSDPTLGQSQSGVLQLAPSPAPGRYHFQLSWDQGRNPNVKVTPDLAVAQQDGDRRIDFRLDNPPPISPPKDAPARYQWLRRVEFSDFADWASISRHFAPLFAKASTLGRDSPLVREAGDIARVHAKPLDRARAALKLVQQDVRYIYVGLNGGNLTPASADETWQRRYGDCKGKTALLLALLTQLGIEAEPVLVNTSGKDDGFEQRLPLPGLFDHVLVRAHIDGKAYWLDGTLPPVALPSAEPLYPASRVLPLTAKGSDLEKLAWHPAPSPDELQLIEIDARAGFDKPARLTSTSIIRGMKGLGQQAQFSAASNDQLLAAFRENAVGDFWQSIEDVQWHYDSSARASILKIVGTGTVSWEVDEGNGRSMALPGGGFSPPERRVRAAGQDQSVPFYTEPEYSCHVTTVRLPTFTQPRQWSAKPSFDQQMFGRRYHRAWELRDGAIRMIRGTRVDQPEIETALAERDNRRIAAFDNSMGWISYDPSETKGVVGKGETVPTTDEIDWTAADVPCLSSAPAK